MDDPRGSVEHAASDELERLRQRAYGPDADIAGDAVAQARLSELETAQRRQPIPVVDPSARVPEPPEGLTASREPPTTRDGTGGTQTDGERPDERALDGAAIPSPTAALETKPRGPDMGRVWRILPWAIASVASLVAAIAIGVLVVNQSSEPRPVAPLAPVARLPAQAATPQGTIPVDEGTAREWGWTDADFVSHGSYGAAEIWSTTTPAPNPKQCLGVVVRGSTWRFNCTSPTLDTIADIDIESNMVPPAPSGEPAFNIRFVLHDGVVDVYLAPNPEGGFY